ncbi:NUT family member 2G-like [Molossus nigricans]
MGQWEEVVLARKSCSGAVHGQVFSEISSPRARLEGAPTAAAQSFSPASSPELPSPQSRELLVVLGPTRAGQPGDIYPDRARNLSCPELSPLCGHSGLQTYVLHRLSHGAPSPLPFIFELRGLLTDHIPALGQKTHVERGGLSRGTPVKADSCIKGKGEQPEAGRRSSASLGNRSAAIAGCEMTESQGHSTYFPEPSPGNRAPEGGHSYGAGVAEPGPASAVLGADVSVDPGASTTPFMELALLPPTAGPTHQPTLEQHLLTLTTLSFPPDQPQALSALPRAPLVAGDAGQGPIGTGACNIIDQVRSEKGQPQSPETQTIVLPQGPLNSSAPDAICGGAVCLVPLFLETSAVETIIPALAFGGNQTSQGGRCPGLPPPAPPAAAQLAPIIPPVNAGPWPHRASREGGLAISQPKASPDGSCNPKILYRDFRRWQLFKALARGHLPQSPDAEALSCFLLPVLQSLSHLKPTMTLEEGIGQAVQEWQHTSNFDRMTYYDMEAKFMEFEAEEDMQIQKLQSRKEVQVQPPPAPRRPDPQGSPAPVVGPQPANTPSTQCAHPLQWPGETESPNGIPPEAVQEYMDIMDYLEGLAHSASGEPGPADSQVTPCSGAYSLFLLSQVETLIDPQLQEKLFSPETQRNPLDIAEFLERKDGLTPVQSVAAHDAQRCDLGPQLGVSEKASPPETDFKDCQRPHLTDAHLSAPRAFAVSSGRQEHPQLWAQCPPSTPQDRGCTYSGLGPRDAYIPREPPLVRGSRRPVDRSREDEWDLPSLAFLLASPKSLLPCVLSLSPVPASGHVCPGARGPQGAAQSRFYQTLGLSRAPPSASKSRKRALGGGLVHAEKTPLPGAELGVSGTPALTLGLVSSSQPQKRKSDQSVPGGWAKRHCSQDVAVGCSSGCQAPGGPRLDVTWLSPRGAKSSFSSQG